VSSRSFVYDGLPVRVVFGAGAARGRLSDELATLGARRVLLCMTEREELLARDLVEPVADRVAGIFRDVRPHVPVEVADAARRLAAECRADAVLAIGGGSTTGTAKAVALTTGLPVVAVPTTYAGSEVTPVWGLTEGNRKRTGRDLRVLPKVVVYDPELTLSLPPELSGVSGLNALAHCVEAFWAAGANPVTSLMAEDGARALAAGLPRVMADPADLAARADTLYGAWLAGSALAVAGSGLHHKICHVLGGAFDLPHAETHAVVLPHVLALFAPDAPDVEARLATAFGVAPGRAVAALVQLARAVGAPAGLRDVGLSEDELPEAIRLVCEALPAAGPRAVTTDDITALMRTAWDGAPGEAA
jgi:alcohol dehydrogenase class IV